MEAQKEKTGIYLETKRVFQAPVARVYQAWTDPQMMSHWYHPGAEMRSECTVDLRVGGRYEIQMHPPEGDPYIVAGAYQEIVPQKKLVFTWRWQGEEYDEGESLVTVTFTPLGEAETELTLLHERFNNEEERENHAQGWEGTFVQLAAALG